MQCGTMGTVRVRTVGHQGLGLASLGLLWSVGSGQRALTDGHHRGHTWAVH